jgi:hypothetical protein
VFYLSLSIDDEPIRVWSDDRDSSRVSIVEAYPDKTMGP